MDRGVRKELVVRSGGNQIAENSLVCHPRCSARSNFARALDLRERLVQIANDVLDVFNPDG